MSYDMQWLVERRIFLTTFKGNINQSVMEHYMKDVRVYIESGTPLVHQISNSLAMGKVEMSLSMMKTLVKNFKQPATFGWQVDVNQNPINKMIANIASQFVGARTRTFPSVEAALAFLNNIDLSLKDVDWEVAAAKAHEVYERVLQDSLSQPRLR